MQSFCQVTENWNEMALYSIYMFIKAHAWGLLCAILCLENTGVQLTLYEIAPYIYIYNVT